MSKQDKSLTEKATDAMKSAVRKVVNDHHRSGRPLAVWEKDRVVMKPTGSTSMVKEAPGNYETGAAQEEDHHAR